MKASYFACGKLLITGEYLILRGARGLALPTSRGQHLIVEPTASPAPHLRWTALDDQGYVWFESDFAKDLTIVRSNDEKAASFLKCLLLSARELNPESDFLENPIQVRTELDFPRDWGLGSSSTLVSLIAQWSGVDSLELLQSCSNGSGYDVRVADHGSTIIFQRVATDDEVQSVTFRPTFSDSLWFVHLGKKMDSQQEVTRFSELEVSERDIDHVSRITEGVLAARSIGDFENLLEEHDLLLGRILARETAAERFSDYSSGYVKYLGAWGGDFLLVTGGREDVSYFEQKGFRTILSYEEMIAT